MPQLPTRASSMAFRLAAAVFVLVIPCIGFGQTEPKSLYELIHESDALIVARHPIDGKFAIDHVFAGENLGLKAGGTLDSPFDIVSQESRTYLMVLDESDSKSPGPEWRIEEILSESGVKYVLKYPTRKLSVRERLILALPALEHDDVWVVTSSQLEFSIVDDDEFFGIADQLTREQLRSGIETSKYVSTKRLYWAWLSRLGNEDDVSWIETRILEDDGVPDMAIACYLHIQGSDGIPFIREKFLEDHEANYIKVYGSVIALHYYYYETQSMNARQHILEATRLLLDQPIKADMIIPKLGVYRDWDTMDKIASLFLNSNDETKYLRAPAAIYMRFCPKPRAAEYLKQFRQLDAGAVRRSEVLVPDSELTDAFKVPEKGSLRMRGRRWANPGCFGTFPAPGLDPDSQEDDQYPQAVGLLNPCKIRGDF